MRKFRDFRAKLVSERFPSFFNLNIIIIVRWAAKYAVIAAPNFAVETRSTCIVMAKHITASGYSLWIMPAIGFRVWGLGPNRQKPNSYISGTIRTLRRVWDRCAKSRMSVPCEPRWAKLLVASLRWWMLLQAPLVMPMAVA